MTRILLCGEGQHDVGEARVWNKATQQWDCLEGWLQPLARKVVNTECVFGVRTRHELVLFPRDQRKFQPMPPGHGAKALVAKLVAAASNFDAVIFMADADSNKVRDWKRIKREITEGFASLPSELPAVACVPKSASESWLLSDTAAWQQLGLEDVTVLPENPETIWGARNDPAGNHPHQVFARACHGAAQPDNRETRLIIAESAELSTIHQKCPLSFGAFHDDLKIALGMEDED